jgi:hypothetical protein
MEQRYLTKSRFKLALECITKLYYTGKKEEYSDMNIDDSFLQALADGGFQVGELAKYYHCNNPREEKITVESNDYDKSLKETQDRLNAEGKIVIAEAAFCYKNFFVRTDIIIKEGKNVFLYEVKAKSFNAEKDKFLNSKGDKLISEWVPYLYDVAFQKYVVSKALKDTGFEVRAHLMLVDINSIASVQGLNQMFKIVKQNGRTKISVRDGLVSSDVGSQITKTIDVDEICQRILDEFPVPTDYTDGIGFEDFINLCAEKYAKDERLFSSLGTKCSNKNCQFFVRGPNEKKLKSGFLECWKNKTNLNDNELGEPLVLELWSGNSGGKSFATELIKKGKFLLKDVLELDVAPKTTSSSVKNGLSSLDRRMEQINRVKNSAKENFFDLNSIKSEMEKWVFPLHMIDFETSMVALPFHKDSRPYEGIAFQFSHHEIDKNWNIKHSGQFISFEPGSYPNYEFIRELKNLLDKDGGSIFRYHNHENSYLNFIYSQLKLNNNAPDDKNELMQFIQSISHSTFSSEEKWKGERDMVDLHQLVLSYYYSPLAKGNNGIKHILPAVIQESFFLKDKYGKTGVYGKNKPVGSLNFDDHIWIRPELGFDPYKTLPKVFEEYDTETLDSLLQNFEELGDGGAALTAYNYLQYSELPLDQRSRIKESLLRYCELDTMAMVMICEAWNDWCKN